MTFEALPRPSPGAMTTAMRALAPRAVALELRVALTQGNRIVDERRLPRGTDVTIGATERCTLLASGPKRVLFATDAGADTGFALVAGGVGGKIVPQHGAPSLDLASLPAGTRIAIGAGARGRVAVGDSTVLFDLVPARIRTRAALPASVKKGLLGDIDWSFTSFVTAALLGCFGFVAVSESADPAIAMDDATTLEAVAHMVIDVPPEPPPAAVVSDPSTHDDPATASTPSTHASRPSNARPSPRPSHADPTPTLDPSEVADQGAHIATLMLVGALDHDSTFRNLLAQGAPTTSQAEIMAQVDGAQVASNDSTMHARDPGGDAGGHGLGNLQRHVATNQADEGHGPVERVVHVLTIGVDPDPPYVDPTDFDPAQVIRMIRLRAPQIQACYEHHLSQAPGAAGKVTVQFTVERAGTVSHVTAIENTADDVTAQCAETVVAGLRFQHGPSDPAQFHFPFVFAPQN